MFRVIAEQNLKCYEVVEFWFENLTDAGIFAQTLIDHVPTVGKTKIIIESEEMEFVGGKNDG